MAEQNKQSIEQQTGRVPPQAMDVEMSVLGAMLLEKEAIARTLEIMDETAFYKPAHTLIFKAVISLFEKNEAADSITVVEELRRMGKLDDVGGPLYISDLTMHVTSAANVEYHAKIVLEKALLRNLISASTELTSRAFNEQDDALDLLDEAENKIFQISEKRLKKSFIPMKEAVFATMEMLESIHGKHSGVTGVPSGFTALDNMTGGFQPSDMIIVAARPSMGKTAFVLSVARNAAVDHAKPIGFFSLEMSAQQLVMRLICAEARVDAHSVRTGRLPEEQWRNLSTRIGKLYNAKIFLDDTPALSVLELRAKARRLKAEHDISMIIIDYLQLMSGPKNAQSREQEISQISRSLKALAKELNIPVVALSQLNRAVEVSTDKRPTLANLRESGAIEQDADVVLFIHRPEKYNIMEEQGKSTQGVAEIIIGKQRNGPTGEVELTFINQYARFENMAVPTFDEFAPPVSNEPAF
jgi:replicative DNA helicase